MKLIKNRHGRHLLKLVKTNIVPTISRVKGKYCYSSAVIKYLKWGDSAQRRICAGIGFRKIRKVKENLEYTLISKMRQSKNYTINEPILIKPVKLPSILLPGEISYCLHGDENLPYDKNLRFYKESTEYFLNFILNRIKRKKKVKNQPNVSVPQMPLAKQNYRLTPMTKKYFKSIYNVNLWMYSGIRVSDWHYDGHDNFLYMYLGKKIVFLAQHHQIPSKSPFSRNSNHCQPFQQGKIKVYVARVNEGQSLFIPKGWWHKVISFGDLNLAVNIWGNSIGQMLQKLQKTGKSLLLKQLLFDLAEYHCERNIQDWDGLEDFQMQKQRKRIGHKMVKQNHLLWKRKEKRRIEQRQRQ